MALEHLLDDSERRELLRELARMMTDRGALSTLARLEWERLSANTSLSFDARVLECLRQLEQHTREDRVSARATRGRSPLPDHDSAFAFNA